MSLLKNFNSRLIRQFIRDYQNTQNKNVRVKYGLLAGWVSVVTALLLFALTMYLGVKSHSISIVANAFHLLSHLANSVILIISFHVTARPATAKNPFGHGRMEHVAPLIMSIFLFVSGVQLAETSLHRTLDSHEVHYWPALIWILLATILVKQFLSRFVLDLGKRVDSRAIRTNAHHHSIEAVMSLGVIGGLVAGHYFHRPEVDGLIGILVSVWLLYLGFVHGREAVVPLLGQAPSREMLGRIRKTAMSVKGVEGVHEIIVHDYGSNYHLSLHVEVPEKYGPAEMHEIAERCEALLRKEYGGAVVCHTDPLMEKTPEIEAMEAVFRRQVQDMPEILSYHDFRVIAHSGQKIIIVADLNAADEVPESGFADLEKELEQKVLKVVPNVAYCSFMISPKYAY
jgi:cation diffusion facilitator family transporter